MSKEKLKFLIFGTPPPPSGGVSISVKNLITALESINIHVELLSKSNLFQFQKFDIGHIHYSKKWKVLVAILLSKLWAKKTIVTKHGAEFYPKNIIWDRLILNLSDGIIVLNDEVYNRCSEKKHLIKLPPIFKEGVIRIQKKNKNYFIKEKEFKYLLIYASGKVFIDNKEVYGLQFVLDLLNELNQNIKVIFLDPSGEYKEDIELSNSSKIIYIDEHINFSTLVSNIDLYIRPTTSDGNSVATLEALSVGTPVLASDIVERDDNSITYKTHDKKEFIEKVHTLLSQTHENNSFELKSIQEYINFSLKILNKKVI